MSKFKKTEHNPIYKVFIEVFLIARIPHFTVLITEADIHRCSVVKGVPKNFSKFTGKHLCQSLFFNKLAGYAEFLRTPFHTERLRWLLL